MSGDEVPVFRVSLESRVVCYIECVRKEDGEIRGSARASGFYWTVGDRLYLVTNWHNVTGLNHKTNKRNGSFAPTHLRVWFNENSDQVQENARLVRHLCCELVLYDANDQPTWLEHPNGRDVDIVAIPIDNYDWKGRVYAANTRKPVEYSPMAGDDCYIVGFPEGLSGPTGTPIWKRASIATEPELDYEGSPIFLADSLTRVGLSGAPVFVRVGGLWGQEGRRIEIGGDKPPVFGFWTNFVGVYAGREGDEKEGFQLARVWKKSALDELIDRGTLATHPHG